MTHRRQQIRTDVVSRVTGLATTGANVVSGRVYPEQWGSLPGLSVYTASEDWDPAESAMYSRAGERIEARRLEVTVEGRTTGTAGVDDDLDQIALEVETALAADDTLGGLVEKFDYTATETELSGELEQPIGVVRILYVATYRVDARDPQ